MMSSPPPTTSFTTTVYLSLTSSPSSPRIPLVLDGVVSVSELRQRVSELTGVSSESMRLIYRGRVISPGASAGGFFGGEDVAREYGLTDGCVVHVVGRPFSSPSVVATTTTTAATTGGGAHVTVPPSSSSSSSSSLASALAKLRVSNDPSTYGVALVTVHKLLGNIVDHPMEEKYRRIKSTNPAFAKRVGNVRGGRDMLFASGFVEEGDSYVLIPSADAWPWLVRARDEVERLLSSSLSSSTTTTSGGSAMGAGGVGGEVGAIGSRSGMAADQATTTMMPGMPPIGGLEAATMREMLSDPNALRDIAGMINNPMFRNMIRSDPRMSNNPMMQQALRALESDPGMIERIMGNPNVANLMGGALGHGTSVGGDPFARGPEEMRAQMETLERVSREYGGTSGGFNVGGGEGGGGGIPPVMTAPSGMGNDDENSGGTTEEEMIAEAIARSLRES